jgi:hypothetical protein
MSKADVRRYRSKPDDSPAYKRASLWPSTTMDLPPSHWPMFSRPDDMADLLAAVAQVSAL